MSNNKKAKTKNNTVKTKYKEPASYIHPFLQNSTPVKAENSFNLKEFLDKGILNNTK